MSLQIAGFDGIDFAPGAADQVIHLAIKVTASADQLPIWRQTMLPPSNADFRREAVLDENQSPARPENPPHVGERRDRIRDRAQGPGHHDCIEYRVKESGGHIRLYSELGLGTTVKVYLPRSTPETMTERVPDRSASILPGNGETVLLVEDDAQVREFSASALSHLGYRALEASESSTALNILAEHF